jgi:hypothetical protein
MDTIEYRIAQVKTLGLAIGRSALPRRISNGRAVCFPSREVHTRQSTPMPRKTWAYNGLLVTELRHAEGLLEQQVCMATVLRMGGSRQRQNSEGE